MRTVTLVVGAVLFMIFGVGIVVADEYCGGSDCPDGASRSYTYISDCNLHWSGDYCVESTSTGSTTCNSGWDGGSPVCALGGVGGINIYRCGPVPGCARLDRIVRPGCCPPAPPPTPGPSATPAPPPTSTPEPCSPPGDPAVVTLTDQTNKILVSWNASAGAAEYRIFRDGLQIGTVYPPTTSFLDATVSCGGAAKLYRVEAVNMGNPPSCQVTAATQTGNCLPYVPWFSVGGGDVVAANGLAGTTLPPVIPEVNLIRDGGSAVSGVLFGKGFYGNINQDNVSDDRWLVNLSPNGWVNSLARSEIKYRSIRDRVMAVVDPVVIGSGSVDQNSLFGPGGLVTNASSQNKINGVVVLRRPGSLDLAGNLDAGANRVIILVDGDTNLVGGNANIGGKLIGTTGYFVVLASGGINVSSLVGEAGELDISLLGYTPHLRGIFYSGGVFSTGTGNLQLRVDGSVIGMGGVNLARTYAGPYPSIYIYFRPEIVVDLLNIGLRRRSFQELIGP